MKLSKNAIAWIKNTVEHAQDQTDDQNEARELKDIYVLLDSIPRRFDIELRRVEIVPESIDHLVNIAVNCILKGIESDDDDITQLEAALWDYLKIRYQYEIDYPVDFLESIRHAIIEIGIHK